MPGEGDRTSAQRIEELNERIRRLSTEKSYLELVSSQMNKIAGLSGIDSIISQVLRSLIDTTGGTNASIYYFENEKIHYLDVYGSQKILETVEDHLVAAAIERRSLVEEDADVSFYKMSIDTKCTSWATPLLVEKELVGVLKLEGTIIGASAIRDKISVFFSYIGLVLKNELLGLSTLKTAYDQLRQKNDLLTEEIRKRKEIERKLIQARIAAEENSTAKSRFLANMSHEIRTPMNAILGYAQLLLRGSTLIDKERQYVETIQKSGNHLLTLINDILEMSKIEAGHTSLNVTPSDLHALLEETRLMFNELTQKKGLELNFNLSSQLVRYIEVDCAKVRQVLVNLLSNAHKFTDTGKIHVRASSNPLPAGRHAITICIEDTGCGIAPEQIDSIFDAFEQSETTAHLGGTGLGMAISRTFARLMAGDLTAKSTVGRGSIFTFTFEAKAVLTTAVDFPLDRPFPACLAPSQKRRKVLVADDNENNRHVLSELLVGIGFEICQATNGIEAVSLFENWQPDIILMDVKMPRMDGLEATRQIRATPAGSDTPIVAVSATALDDSEQEAVAAGMDAFLRKPFTHTDILETIARLVDVEYVYKPTAENNATTAQPAKAVNLDTIPKEMKERIQMAVITGRIEDLLSLVEELSTQEPDRAEALRSLAQSFEYEEILVLLEGNG